LRKATEIKEAFADRSMLDGYKAFFLVGIGGAGMNALARMLKHRGYAVFGTDSTRSPETDRLIEEGIPVQIGHTGGSISDRHALVLSDAIDLDTSPEVARAKELGVPLFRRSQALGWLLRDRKVIAVTGTHGKTTTTGMVGAGLIAAGLDPLIVVGASVPDFGGPVVEGKGEFAVVEACEAYDAFHDFDPFIVLLTNLELDHVDFHENWENLRGSVSRFVGSLPKDGVLVYCEEDAGATEIAQSFDGLKRGYSGNGFDIAVPMVDGRKWSEYLAAPGRHNWLNANGAMTAIEVIVGRGEAYLDAMTKGIATFRGAERRLQVLQDEPVTVIDDYAHHPTEIAASLSALTDRYPYRRLIVVYQPHLYSRTEPLIKEFAEALSLADEVVLTDIYPAREAPIPGVSSARIAELIAKPVLYVPNRHLLARKVAAIVRPGDVVVGMGAGNIAEFAPALVKELASRPIGVPPPKGGQPDADATTTVAVIYGGDSAEREVSLLSGRCVYEALKRLGFDAKLVDVSELLIRSGDLKQFTGPERPDLAFLAVHGTNAEDGAIQGLFELLHVPYTGSGVQASALAMDKQLTKSLLRAKGIRVPEGVLVTRSSEVSSLGSIGWPSTRPLSSETDDVQLVPRTSHRGEGRYVVKPNAQGSTVGLTFVDREEDLERAVQKALQYDTSALVEERVVGMEISVPVLGDRALPPVEIAPVSGRYDFASKYTPGATEEIVPARLPAEVIAKVQEIALAAHRALGCVGATRTDMIVRRNPSPGSGDSSTPLTPSSKPNHFEEWGEIFTLEVNTLPGMTATSLLPNSAKAAGIEFDDLVRWLVEDALARYAKA
jgi:UDP-N-acetylmuramate--L-alanine ligase